MNIIFRVDSGYHIGIGHLMRCTNLAENLNGNIEFICRNHNDSKIDIIRNKYKLYLLELKCNINFSTDTWLGSSYEDDARDVINIIGNRNIDLLIVDHYSIDYRWENMLRSSVKKILVIDDLQNRQHNCDILIDQNIIDNNYDNLVPKHCKKLIGLDYLLINNKFFDYTDIKKSKKIIISFGGMDSFNMCEKIFNFLKINLHLINDNDITFHFVSNYLYKKYNNNNSRFYIFPILSLEELIKLSANAYLAIGASGVSIYERIIMGIYNIIITIAENQKKIAKKIDELGYGKYIGHYHNFNLNDIIKIINNKVKLLNKIKLKHDHYNNILDKL